MSRGVVILLLLVSDVQIPCAQTPRQTESPGATLAAEFSLKSLDGKVVRLKEFKGKITVLNFWATWCAPCRAEIPQLVKLQKEYQSRGLRILGITYPPASRQRVRSLVGRLGINYPVLLGTRKVALLYDVESVLPVSIVIDREGRIIKRIDGMADPRHIERMVP